MIQQDSPYWLSNADVDLSLVCQQHSCGLIIKKCEMQAEAFSCKLFFQSLLEQSLDQADLNSNVLQINLTASKQFMFTCFAHRSVLLRFFKLFAFRKSVHESYQQIVPT